MSAKAWGSTTRERAGRRDACGTAAHRGERPLVTSATVPLADLAAQAGAPVARIYGEPLLEMPRDLYIPPEALSVFLETFEGPLDLLLYLIRKENINVLDIPMAELTRQYLGYVEMMRRTQLELAAEYLLMAAVLIEIKSRLLLPKPPAAHADEGADPRAELVRRLLEYERMKLAARKLDELPLLDRDFTLARVWLDRLAVARLPEVRPSDLRAAWEGLVARARVNRHHLVTREQLSVRGEMSRLLKVLDSSRYAEFTTLFAPHADVAHLIVTFLALLELAREELIGIAQAEPYAPIYVQRKGERGFALAADVE
jgi:segregation and condensation protein A